MRKRKILPILDWKLRNDERWKQTYKTARASSRSKKYSNLKIVTTILYISRLSLSLGKLLGWRWYMRWYDEWQRVWFWWRRLLFTLHQVKSSAILHPLRNFAIHTGKVEMGFYTDIFWESRCHIEIYVWSHFYKMPGKS